MEYSQEDVCRRNNPAYDTGPFFTGRECKGIKYSHSTKCMYGKNGEANSMSAASVESKPRTNYSSHNCQYHYPATGSGRSCVGETSDIP